MKHCLFIFMALLIGSQLSAQEVEKRKGYIGISFGTAFSKGDINTKNVNVVGSQFNLNFGYLYSDHVGIAFTWFGNAFTEKKDKKNYIGLGGMMVGPLFSTADNNGKVEFDLKPMIGFGRGVIRYYRETITTDMGFSLGLGTAARFNINRFVSLSYGLDYYYSKPEKINLSSLAISFGINYRIK